MFLIPATSHRNTGTCYEHHKSRFGQSIFGTSLIEKSEIPNEIQAPIIIPQNDLIAYHKLYSWFYKKSSDLIELKFSQNKIQW